MVEDKIKITQEDKIKFNVEIMLTHQQLLMMAELNGWGEVQVEEMKEMQESDEPLTSNANFQMGLGSDINYMITRGFLLLMAMHKDLETKVSHDQMYYCPYTIGVLDLEKLHLKWDESNWKECEVIVPGFNKMLTAIDRDGNVVHASDI